MLYRYEIYDGDEAYAGCGFLTGLRRLYGTSISDEHIRRIAKPFTRDLDFPILEDKDAHSTSLFTEEGHHKFALDIISARKTYEQALEETGLVMRLIEVPRKEFEGCVLYEDEYQVLVEESRMDAFRRACRLH